jgi:hypothetical protein
MAPPKTCPKMVCPRKGVAFLWKAFLQKIFRVWEKIPLSALPFGRSHTLVAEGFSVHSSLISGLLGREGIWYPFKSLFWGQRRRSGCAIDAAAIQRKGHIRTMSLDTRLSQRGSNLEPQ